jgi:integrase
MADATINRTLQRLGYSNVFSAHGFRSTASTMLNELGYRSDLIEKQLAHTERNMVRASYNQAQYLDERKNMMQGWADLIDQLESGSNVVPGEFRRAKNSA